MLKVRQKIQTNICSEFSQILNSIVKICAALATFGSGDEVHFVFKDPYLVQLKDCLVALENCPNYRARFWCDFGRQAFFKMLDKRGIPHDKDDLRLIHFDQSQGFYCSSRSLSSSTSSLLEVYRVELPQMEAHLLLQGDESQSQHVAKVKHILNCGPFFITGSHIRTMPISDMWRHPMHTNFNLVIVCLQNSKTIANFYYT